ncbi:MAG: DUF362 domain-containing protein [Patescibacteria group bacterium]
MTRFTKKDFLEQATVAIWKTGATEYFETAPYHPDEAYPEYPFGVDTISTGVKNPAYSGVREVLHTLGFDAQNYGTKNWNPLSDIIAKGNTVVIKPNAVWDKNLNRAASSFASITHGSVMRALVDYAYIALGGTGRIVIADAPIIPSNFDNWRKITGMDEMIALYKKEKNFDLEVYDLRTLIAPWDAKSGYSPSSLREIKERDPAGYREIDLRGSSEFAKLTEKQCSLFYGADYDNQHTVRNHTGGAHRYKVAQTFLNADVIISVPKLKTHMKVGATLNIKSMVGTQGDKNYIPHCRIGDPSRGGDEYPDLGMFQNALNRFRMWGELHVLSHENKLADTIYRWFLRPIQYYGQGVADRIGRKKCGKDYIGNINGGSWYGNDTAWRMSLDLIRIILYSDRQGALQNTPQRIFLALTDGIIAGEAEGPLRPSDKRVGTLIGSLNPLAADAVSVTYMGFDADKMATLRVGLKRSWLKRWKGNLDAIPVKSNDPSYVSVDGIRKNHANFIPQRGWRGHIEL